jgi:murein DD-endopeptidase MepM/ murein hydrolase activator NlpD
VLHAGPLGIYGQTVVLDHGLGLTTLYGHLSTLEVEPGQMVERGQRLGLSGATGLALGDHLHFSTLVGGVFVNPAEWWDPHWIADNVALRFDEAGLPRP